MRRRKNSLHFACWFLCCENKTAFLCRKSCGLQLLDMQRKARSERIIYNNIIQNVSRFCFMDEREENVETRRM